MNNDNRTHYDADHTTKTNEDNWEDDGLDYSEEIKKLPLAVRLGGMLCTNFAMLTSGDFSWDVIPALKIYQVVSNYAPDMTDFRDRGISTEDLLSGIEIYKAIKSSAAP